MVIYKKITITLPKEVFEKFKEYCREEGMNVSSRIAVLIMKDLKKC